MSFHTLIGRLFVGSPLIGSPMPAKAPDDEEDEPPLIDHSDLHVLEICEYLLS